MHIAKALTIAALCGCIPLMSGCGGAGSSASAPGISTPSPSVGTGAHTANISGGAIASSAGGSALAPADAAKTGGTTMPAHAARHTGSQGRFDAGHVQVGHINAAESDDDNAGGAKPANPCQLVTLSEARGITRGAVVGRTEAPLGPTCVYRVRGGKRAARPVAQDITLAVERRASSLPTRSTNRTGRMDLSGRTAYCKQLKPDVLLVPLSGGRELNVRAPCAIAARFAIDALRRVASSAGAPASGSQRGR